MRLLSVRLAASAVVFCFVGLMAFVSGAGAEVAAKPFGISKFTVQTTGPTKEIPLGNNLYEFVNEPEVFTQAGGHPWALTTVIEMDSEEIEYPDGSGTARGLIPTRDAKDLVVDLPPGLLGDPLALPRCPRSVVTSGKGRCPAPTQVGEYRIRWFEGKETLAPIVNVEPEAGQSAEFVLENAINIETVLTAHLVRTPQGLGFDVASNRIPEVGLSRIELTFWGVPADPSHNALRGRLCGSSSFAEPLLCTTGTGGLSDGEAPVPFLVWPTDCSEGPGVAVLRGDSWEEPGRVEDNQQFVGYQEKQAVLPGVAGCNLLAFDPSVEVSPSEYLADAPVGVGVGIKVPQPESPNTLDTPTLRNAVVSLPEGMSISPGVVDGVKACNLSGPEGINFTGPESEEVGPAGELQLAPGHCPPASIVGTAEAITPLLPAPVKGHVYLARPGCGGAEQAPCTEQDALDGNLYQLYLELGGTGALGDAGIQIKVAGKTEANPATGQLTTVFEDNPQTPFSELKVKLNSGPRAPIDNPAACGRATTTSDFTPWSEPGITPEGLLSAGTPDATPVSFFDVEGCSHPTPFGPGFVAGTVTPQAGQYSAFTLNFSRQDREQFVKGIQVHTPPGLLGMLSAFNSAKNRRPTRATAPNPRRSARHAWRPAPGSHPFEIEGTVYLTGPHDGAPFGLERHDACGRGPVQPRPGGGTSEYRRQPGRFDADRHDRRNRSVCAAADPRWRSAATETHHRGHRPSRLHVQPDQLRARSRSRR